MNTIFMDPPQNNLNLMSSSTSPTASSTAGAAEFHHQEYAFVPISSTVQHQSSTSFITAPTRTYSPVLSSFHHQQQDQFSLLEGSNHSTFSDNAYYFQHHDDNIITLPSVTTTLGISLNAFHSTGNNNALYHNTAGQFQVQLSNRPSFTRDLSTTPPLLPALPPQQPNINHQAPQMIRWAQRPKFATSFWEDEKTLCYQVDANGICVARRQDNDMVNGTKLLNVSGISRGKRDGILKNEKARVVVKVGPMHLKGVWITFHRAKELSTRFGITEILHPLLLDDPSVYSHQANAQQTNKTPHVYLIPPHQNSKMEDVYHQFKKEDKMDSSIYLSHQQQETLSSDPSSPTEQTVSSNEPSFGQMNNPTLHYFTEPSTARASSSTSATTAAEELPEIKIVEDAASCSSRTPSPSIISPHIYSSHDRTHHNSSTTAPSTSLFNNNYIGFLPPMSSPSSAHQQQISTAPSTETYQAPSLEPTSISMSYMLPLPLPSSHQPHTQYYNNNMPYNYIYNNSSTPSVSTNNSTPTTPIDPPASTFHQQHSFDSPSTAAALPSLHSYHHRRNNSHLQQQPISSYSHQQQQL